MCAPCQAKALLQSQNFVSKIQNAVANEPIEGCDYTKVQVQEWLTKIECFKSKFLYLSVPNMQVRTINRHAGILGSALNSHPCYFAQQLAEVEQFMVIVENTGEC